MFRPFWDLKPKTAKDSSAGERTFNIATEEIGGLEQIGSFQRRFRSGTGRKQLLFCAPVQGAGIAMEETFIPALSFSMRPSTAALRGARSIASSPLVIGVSGRRVLSE